MQSIIVATISGGLALIGTLIGTYFANRKSSALIAYRLEQLEKKVQAHNNLVERTYKLESRMDGMDQALADHERLYGEKISVANHRIDDLENETRGS